MKLFRTTDDTTTDDETSYDENGDTAMSAEPTSAADDRQPTATPPVTDGEYPAEPVTADQAAAGSADQPQPTFTPAPVDDATPAAYDATPAYDTAAAVDEPATAFPADGSVATPPTTSAVDQPVTTTPVTTTPTTTTPVTTTPTTTATTTADARPADEPVAAYGSADERLLGNSTGMRASWQKVQAEFVDDPQAAVLDAADLIEQTAQSLVDALQERQRQLRGETAGPGADATSAVPDTEHLRLMMRRYRTLFDQLCNA